MSGMVLEVRMVYRFATKFFKNDTAPFYSLIYGLSMISKNRKKTIISFYTQEILIESRNQFTYFLQPVVKMKSLTHSLIRQRT